VLAIDRRINESSAAMGEAERAGDFDKRDRMALEYVELTKRRSLLLPGAEAAGTGV
jgi:hypothetical protein